MAKRQRRDRSGVGTKHGRLYINFTWRGIRCKEYVNVPDTPENRKTWENHLGLINAQIKAARFEYRAWFPNGTKLGVFYPDEDQATGRPMTLRAWLEKWHARRSPFRADNSLMPDAPWLPPITSNVGRAASSPIARRQLRASAGSNCGRTGVPV